MALSFDNYICTDTCMTGLTVQDQPTEMFIDGRQFEGGHLKRVMITLMDGTVVTIFVQGNAIHIIRPDGSTLDENHIPDTSKEQKQ